MSLFMHYVASKAHMSPERVRRKAWERQEARRQQALGQTTLYISPPPDEWNPPNNLPPKHVSLQTFLNGMR